jgi:hemerythrin superfamily protein
MMMSDMRPGGSDDPLDFLSHQHRQVEQIWIQLESAHQQKSDIQSRLTDDLVALLTQHDFVETNVLYPALRERAGAPGAELADRSLEEHRKVREELRQIDGQDPRDASVWSVISQCVADVTRHVEEEEREVFPLLRKHWDAEEQRELCRGMSATLGDAPRHPVG